MDQTKRIARPHRVHAVASLAQDPADSRRCGVVEALSLYLATLRAGETLPRRGEEVRVHVQVLKSSSSLLIC